MAKQTFVYAAVLIVLLSVCAANAQPDGSVQESETRDELRQTREELDSAKALLEYHGIKPFKHRVVLSASVAYEIMVVNFGTRLAFNLNSSVSPYIGAALGVGSGFSLLGSAGVEKVFVYKNGFSIKPSLGIFYGEFGYDAKFYPLAGIEAAADFSFRSHYRRLSPYLTVGARVGGAFDNKDDGFEVYLGFLSIIGAGLSLKI
jgi:hypothetical protein